MHITFDVEHGDDGSRELFIEGTGALVGWINQGRRFVDGHGNLSSEWAFEPAYRAGLPNVCDVRHTISEAYADARAYAEEHYKAITLNVTVSSDPAHPVPRTGGTGAGAVR